MNEADSKRIEALEAQVSRLVDLLDLIVTKVENIQKRMIASGDAVTVEDQIDDEEGAQDADSTDRG